MNGHIAFNDPPADFNELRDVRVVELDRLSRMQQVEEGLFPAIEGGTDACGDAVDPAMLRAEKAVLLRAGRPEAGCGDAGL